MYSAISHCQLHVGWVHHLKVPALTIDFPPRLKALLAGVVVVVGALD